MSYKNFYEVVPSLINNVSIEVLVNTPTAGDMTINLKSANGSDLSFFNFGRIGFRVDPNTSSFVESLRVNANLALVVPAGATLGFASAVETPFYVYAINSSGTIELAVSRLMIDESQVRSSIAIGTGSDVNNVLYSTTARTNKPIRLLAKVVSTQTTAGTWSTSPAVLYMANQGLIRPEPIFFSAYQDSGQSVPNNTLTTIFFDTLEKDSHNGITNIGTTSWLYTPAEAGIYDINSTIHFTFNATGTRLQSLYVAATRKKDLYLPVGHGSSPEGSNLSVSLNLQTTDTLQIRGFQNSGGALSLNTSGSTNHFNYISISKR